MGTEKKDDKRAGRAILVKSGDLRRSIRFDTVNKSNLSVRIASDLPYARIHNEGLTEMLLGKPHSKCQSVNLSETHTS